MNASTTAERKFGYVRLNIHSTGEIREWLMAGIDKHVTDDGEPQTDDWRENSLALALSVVEPLMDEIDSARMRGRCVLITVSDGPTAETT